MNLPVLCTVALLSLTALLSAQSGRAGANLALFATPATSYVSGHETLAAIQDGYEPAGVNDHGHGCYGNWPKTGTQWLQYEWEQPVSTGKSAVYWWDDNRGVRLPKAARLLWWDGSRFVPVKSAIALGVAGGTWNELTFEEITTTKLRLEIDGSESFSTGVIEWKVEDSGKSPKFAPHVSAGSDRVVVLPAKTYLRGEVRGGKDSVAWSRESGPGRVTFGGSGEETTAEFAAPGDYVLKLTASYGGESASSTLRATVTEAVPKARLEPIDLRWWVIDSPFWNARLKAQVVNWIPHCIAKLSEPGLKEGGIENFVEAANKLAGRPAKLHAGAPWSNAYTLNTLESMCLAMMLDPGDDAEIAQAQSAIRVKLEKWVPTVLAAQEPDGYLQTRFTLGTAKDQGKTPGHWTVVGDHEGYVAGYFLDAAIAHFRFTGGKDRRLYEAAKRLADCWDAQIGPAPKQRWFDGHQAMEMALVRFGRLVNQVDGAGKGDRYIQLSKFLLDCRGGKTLYDQSHVPVTEQYEAVGHAVRASYCYSAIADIAMATGDAAYHSAAKSLWHNIVDRKLYLTGGIGASHKGEAFGANDELPNDAYGESCANCGFLFFLHRTNCAYHQSRDADLMEDVLYNAILGSVDLPGQNFTYTNPLDQTHERYPWHVCPCCVGNIPRTLLNLPLWMYAKSEDGLRVNLYAGSSIQIDPSLEIVQHTGYPWQSEVELTVKPATPRRFSLGLRVPNRNVSRLYRAAPPSGGLESLTVNGTPVTAQIENGYAVIRREWQSGDTVSFQLPMAVQRVRADERVAANRGRVALRHGPLIYNFEAVDQKLEAGLSPHAELTARWEPDLLGGIIAIRGNFADGSPLLAIPNYARNNRGGRSVVWINEAP